MPGDDRKDRSMRPGELGIREMSRTAVTEQPEEKVKDRTARKGNRGQTVARTWQVGQDSNERTARTVRIWLLGQDY